ncbi:phosphoadenylyl-sulfate reductase [Psychromarinibacter sp. C21-152]|uniref:Adenosine 5'-phosphosulfate reductase n=2 Tax=Psychromarinibacter sediminicola TaxID=3033385 RepID=A0AAE3NQW0_9RHOB|nr:phosphoadenylyl-sulfate reductase [Psychromarinibacter sediminicola]
MAHLDIPGLLKDTKLGRTAIVSSFGAESVVLLHYVVSVLPDIPVLFLDTGKHFPETLAYRDEVADALGLNLQVATPDSSLLEKEDPYGVLYGRDPNACCTIRKTFPLQDAIAPFDSWISGRKRYQGASRAALPILERDGEKIKINPMASWLESDVRAYFARHDLPRHPLEANGYPSIGCAPCTQPVAAGDDQRAGRWAHMPDKTECGIHLGPDGRFVRSAQDRREGE